MSAGEWDRDWVPPNKIRKSIARRLYDYVFGKSKKYDENYASKRIIYLTSEQIEAGLVEHLGPGESFEIISTNNPGT